MNFTPAAGEAVVPVDLADLPANQLPEWLSMMLLIREFEESCEALARDGSVPGGAHQAVGQEAVAVGAIRALEPADQVASGHRPHHHALAKGMDPRAAMAELFGRATGVVGGRGGSMHVSDRSIGYLGGNGIVGASLGLAMGVALGAKLRHEQHVAVAFFGDGAANTGRTWEAVNLAAVWKLPLIAICENNQYAVETAISDVMSAESIAARAAGFGVPSVQIDGQDVGAVYRAVSEARARAMAGDGPTFIEAVTYRYYGHNTGEVITYRTMDEVNLWRASRDPIEKLVGGMTMKGLLAEGQLTGLTEDAKRVVKDAIEFARNSPWPEMAAPDLITGLRPVLRGNP
jgi:TPP-dependent pyruvate/acetoin dehydrogenase alpha subunit